MEEELSRAEFERALSGDPEALASLVHYLNPVVQARVARVLLRRVESRAYDVRQEVEDLAQEVFVALFADGARVLRTWDPDRGLSLRNFVGFVAERQAAGILRTGKRNPWTEDPTLTDELDGAEPGASLEATITSRDVLRRLLRRLEERLTPLGRHLFDLIYLREHTVDEVGATTGLSADAVYAWRSRLRRLARGMLMELSTEAGKGTGH
jgi:RNA polymerase sigma-70 factor (ECF subfamily)